MHKYWLIAVLLVACAAAGWFLWWQNNHLVSTRYQLRIGLDRQLRIVHLSDLHGKQFGTENVALIARVEACKPDLIVFTGDLIDNACSDRAACVAFLGELTRLAPVLYVPGNHEYNAGLVEELRTQLLAAGVRALSNEIVTLELNGRKLHALGMEETAAGSAPQLLTELQARQGIKLVLSHYPETFALGGAASYQNYAFDVQFSGHAHGGQFILPGMGPVFAPGQGLRPRYARGVHGNRPCLVVSRGLGNSAFPFRLFNLPEVVLAVLE